MEPKEDSIKMLEMRIRHQLNRSLEKNIQPENMQYYLSSSAMHHQGGLQQVSYNDDNGGLYQSVHTDVKKELRQTVRVDGNGNIWQEIPVDVNAAKQHIQNDEDAGQRREMDAAGPEPVDTQQYENQPFDTSEYIDRVGGLVHMIESIEISETKEAQHARARSGYERACGSLDTEQSPEPPKNHLLDAKG